MITTRTIGAITVAVAIFASTIGCATSNQSQTRLGPAQRLGHGVVRTYAVTDSTGQMTGLGVAVTAAALDGLPGGSTATTLMLDLPSGLPAEPFTCVMLNWNPRGHQPTALFGKPHFDIHFDMVTMSDLQAISPSSPGFAAKAAHLPDAAHTPQGFAPLPGPPLAAQAVPGMGLHLADAGSRPTPGHYNFQHILLAGSWDGRYTFIEPMIARDWLLARRPYAESVHQPVAYQHDGRYPLRYSSRFDSGDDTYRVELSDFVTRRAS